MKPFTKLFFSAILNISLVRIPFFILLLAIAFSNVYSSATTNPLMRFPNVSENLIVFVSGEDIWTAPVEGGVATRLTIHDGEERYPKFSPDGNLIAFTGYYDGNADVYVMNIHGGDITRVTYHPGYDQVVGWHPLKNKIIFSSSRNSFEGFSRLFLISPDGSGLEELILHEAVQGSFSPDGKQIAYNRVSRENRTWKRYQGGDAQDIYLFNFETNMDKKITNFEGTDRIPMWIGNKIYFSSDRDRVLNIYAYDTGTGKTEQITHHSEYDVRRPSMGAGKIVYELGGNIWLLDTKTNKSTRVPIEIRTDEPETRPYLKNVKDFLTGIDCSPGGERALLIARGEIFSVPREKGATRNLTGSSGARDKDAVWSPDGKQIAFLSDMDGEYQIYVMEAKGAGNPVRLTDFKDGYRHTLRWSPDSKKIAFADQTLRCYYLDINTKKIIEVDKAEYENVDVSLDLKPISDFAWSPDSRYLAYSKMNEDVVYQVYIYSLKTGKSHCVSNGLFNDFNPVFSNDGAHLVFISNRRFNPTFGDFDWQMVYKKMAGIYSLTLTETGKPLFPMESDEVKIKNQEGAKNSRKKEGEKPPGKTAQLKIDFEGISNRIEPFPLPRGNYRNLSVNDNSLFYLNKDEGDFNRFEFREIGLRSLYAFSFKDRKAHTVIKNINSYKLSADGSKIVYQKNNGAGIIEATARESAGKNLNLSALDMWLNPLAEWKQVFSETWRMERDFYYEPNMHGLDWPAMKAKYQKLIDRATCRQDVRFIVGELIGELNTSHTYVFGGDFQREAERVNVGMLGVDWETDPAANRYKFKKIYRVPDWTREILPPLLRPGLNVEEGDYLLKVNGVEITAGRNIYSYFQNLAGQQVLLTIGKTPDPAKATDIIVKPIRSERRLRYLNWVEHNRVIAERESNGQIGYLHLPDTYTASARIFPKYFYSQTRKKGLIIDGRFNGGGLDPDIFLSRLNARPHSYWTRRYSHDQTAPFYAVRAHMVCLTNRQAGSGGDELPFEFQELGMGPVIGTRTWGGLVGVSMFIELIDGGVITVPDYRIYSPGGKWVVENKGVQPDIVVDLDPVEMAREYDAQLMKGIEVLMKKINADPRPWPKHEPFPVDK